MNTLGLRGVEQAGYDYSDLLQAREDNARLIEFREKTLAEEFIEALSLAPHAHVKTAAWGWDRRHAKVMDVIADEFSGSSDTSLAELLEFVAEQAKAGNEKAKAWVNAAAERYAKWHAADDVGGVL